MDAFNIQVGALDTLSEVLICKFDGQSWSEPFKKTDFDSDLWIGNFRDSKFDKQAIYYARITQSDGAQAWCSLIWVQAKRSN